MRFLMAFATCVIGAVYAAAASAGDAERGYRLLVEKPFLPPDFDRETFDGAWRQWPEPLRSQAEQASPGERRRLAFAR